MSETDSNCSCNICFFIDLNDNISNMKADKALHACQGTIEATSNFLHGEKSVCQKSLSPQFKDLPVEILLKIFGYLSQAELYYRISSVNRLWKQVALDETLWKSIDYNTMHEDSVMLYGTKIDLNSNENQTALLKRGDPNCFKRTMSTFSNCVTTIKLSRYVEDQVSCETLSQCLRSCKNLMFLDLGFSHDLDLRNICSNCLQLRSLSLDGCNSLRDDDFSLISNLTSLHTLDVSHCVFLTSKFLHHLYNVPNLRQFSCGGVMNISDRELIVFFEHQTLLETVVLDGEDMTDTPIRFAADNLPSLKCLKIKFCETLSDSSVLAFQGKYQLEELNFKKANEVSSSAFCQLFNAYSVFNLTDFSVTECIGFDDASLIALSACCPNLKKICVDWCTFTDDGIQTLILNCKKLQCLSFVGMLSLTGIPWASDLEKTLPLLEYLDMSMCNCMCHDVLVALVARKPALKVFSYYHEQLPLPLFVHGVLYPNTSSKEEWKCPGERGAKVDF